MSRLSIVLPAYNEELMVGKTCKVLKEELEKAGIAYELVLVDDGSKDRTWEEIKKAGFKDANVVGIHFSRNFGKEAAICAGLAQAEGDVVAVMDCDLQHPPETLLQMYALWQKGYEVIEGKLAIADIMKASREGKLEEVFGTGTAAVVSPVKELVWKNEHAFIGEGKIGPVTQKLYDTLTGIQWGKLPDTFGWTRVVK